MQPDQHGGQVPPPQAQNPVAAQAFQSSVPHPQVMPVNPNVQPLNSVSAASLGGRSRSMGMMITLVLLALALAGALGFGFWAFATRQNYKNNSDQISATAVEKALAEQKVTLDAGYAEQAKLPYSTYTAKAEAASIVLQYPRTWSAYIIEAQNASTDPVDGYIHPGFVPESSSSNTAFALRIEVVNRPYSEVIKPYEQQLRTKEITIAPYAFPKVPGSLGSIVRGKIIQGKDQVDGTLVLMPVRDKTIKLWTESNSAFLNDFNTAVLPNFSFAP